MGWKLRLRGETAMWSKIRKLRGFRAANNWLRDVAPDRQARVGRRYDEGISKIERTLARDAELLDSFRIVVKHAKFIGRVNGLREGLDLYEYGTRIQNDNTPAFRAIMNFILRQAEGYEGEALVKETSAMKVCKYLDQEIERTTRQETPNFRISVKIRPPEKWGCVKWKDALENKSSSVHNLISKARKEALSDQYWTLMAWKTWCRPKSRGRIPKDRQNGTRDSNVKALLVEMTSTDS